MGEIESTFRNTMSAPERIEAAKPPGVVEVRSTRKYRFEYASIV
jgi:hypothetical protein